MEPIFRQEYKITAFHLDCFGRARPSVLLHFAQEAAGAHCLELAADWDTLAARHMFWAVTRQKLQITRLPRLGERITVETWPMPTTKVAYPRSTVAYDQEGNEVFRAISLWVLMNTDTRAMILPGKSGLEIRGALRGNELAVPSSLHPQLLEHTCRRRVVYGDLDRNRHMNNARYMDWVDDLLPSRFHETRPAHEITICYHAEATEGQELTLNYRVSQEGELRVDGLREKTDVPGEQERIFSAQVCF